MCTYSMIVDIYTNKPNDWWKPLPPATLEDQFREIWQKRILEDKIKELEELLQRAREYDKKNNQPDCEMDEKKQALKKIADELGIEIKFL